MTQDSITSPTQQSLGHYTTYREAERVVDALSDRGFPVEQLAIVGCDLRMIENIVGRMTIGRAAMAGAASGAWFGVLVGLVFWIVSPWAVGAVISATLLGAAFGAVFGAVAQAATKGRRDFESVSRIEPTSYEVLVEAAGAAEAQRMLGQAAAYPSEPAKPEGVDTTRRTRAR